MKENIKVSVEDIKEAQNERVRINNTNIHEIDFYEDGKKLNINNEILDKFCYTGLSNTYFILSGFYKEKLGE